MKPRRKIVLLWYSTLLGKVLRTQYVCTHAHAHTLNYVRTVELCEREYKKYTNLHTASLLQKTFICLCGDHPVKGLSINGLENHLSYRTHPVLSISALCSFSNLVTQIYKEDDRSNFSSRLFTGS